VRIRAQGMAPDFGRVPVEHSWAIPGQIAARSAASAQPAKKRRRCSDSDHLAVLKAQAVHKATAHEQGAQQIQLQQVETCIAAGIAPQVDREALTEITATERSPALDREALATSTPALQGLKHLYIVAHRVRKLLASPPPPSRAARRKESAHRTRMKLARCTNSPAHSRDSASMSWNIRVC
jgi:hypothetical protein